MTLPRFIGGSPATDDQLRSRYDRQVVGQSSDGSQSWLNWMLRRSDSGELIGTVQATVTHAGPDGDRAELSWVVSTAHQRQGYARESATAMTDWLRSHHVAHLAANVHPNHHASAAIARGLGLARKGAIVDGEEEWAGHQEP